MGDDLLAVAVDCLISEIFWHMCRVGVGFCVGNYISLNLYRSRRSARSRVRHMAEIDTYHKRAERRELYWMFSVAFDCRVQHTHSLSSSLLSKLGCWRVCVQTINVILLISRMSNNITAINSINFLVFRANLKLYFYALCCDISICVSDSLIHWLCQIKCRQSRMLFISKLIDS